MGCRHACAAAIWGLVAGAPRPAAAVEMPLPPERPAAFGTAAPPAPAPPMPVPRERPADLGLASPTNGPGPEMAPPAPAVPLPPERRTVPEAPGAALPIPQGDQDLACKGLAIRPGLAARPESPVASGLCGIPRPWTVTALAERVPLRPAAQLNCPMTLALADWVREAVMPAAERSLGSALAGIDLATSYDCRTTNHVAGAKLSEHAFGNAADIAGFRLADGRSVTIGPDAKLSEGERSFLAAIRKAACATFATVLGPGSDAEHGNHLHLDLRGRNGDFRICQ